MLLDHFPPIRQAKEWASKAPRYSGEFQFAGRGADPVVFGVFGDSVACGLGISSLERTFAGEVARRLSDKGRVVCRIHAFSGARGRDLPGQKPCGDERFAAVSIGTNDIVHGESFELLEHSVCMLLEELKHAERVVIAGPGDLAAFLLVPQVLRPLVRWKVATCEETLRRAAKRYPNARHFGPSDMGLKLTAEHFAADGFHPSEGAHGLIADHVYSRLIS